MRVFRGEKEGGRRGGRESNKGTVNEVFHTRNRSKGEEEQKVQKRGLKANFPCFFPKRNVLMISNIANSYLTIYVEYFDYRFL